MKKQTVNTTNDWQKAKNVVALIKATSIGKVIRLTIKAYNDNSIKDGLKVDLSLINLYKKMSKNSKAIALLNEYVQPNKKRLYSPYKIMLFVRKHTDVLTELINGTVSFDSAVNEINARLKK